MDVGYLEAMIADAEDEARGWSATPRIWKRRGDDFLFSDEVTEHLRRCVGELKRFREFCEADDPQPLIPENLHWDVTHDEYDGPHDL